MKALSLLLLVIIALAGCSSHDGMKHSSASTMPHMMTARAEVKPSQAATTQPTDSNVTGTVTFTQTGDNMRISVDLSGFAPNSVHGFHIHEKGDFTDAQLLSAGGHFNPAGHQHGAPGSPLSHAGDLGNLTADANGNVKTELVVKGISLDPKSATNIVGRGVVVHAGVDDLKTDPAGKSGSRIAGGKIVASSM